jgi:D-glycero-D-manno-heptose 1,7-bisphosphate phosphatase
MKLVILDRDGVINHDSDQYIKSPEEWKPIPGSLAAIARLNQAGYRVVVATNQSGVGRGLFETDTLIAIHDKMHKALAQVGGRIDAIFFCPHTNADNCDCRKPKPGMLREIAARFNADLTGVPAIGDSPARPAGRRRRRRAADAGADRQGCARPSTTPRCRRHPGFPRPRRRGSAYRRMSNGRLRSLLFLLILIVVTPPYTLGVILCWPAAASTCAAARWCPG